MRPTLLFTLSNTIDNFTCERESANAQWVNTSIMSNLTVRDLLDSKCACNPLHFQFVHMHGIGTVTIS
jgi:hypothetical protein